ncbi:MAG: hypothetical protein Tsb0021_15610 [Chlamydiales bacterium]
MHLADPLCVALSHAFLSFVAIAVIANLLLWNLGNRVFMNFNFKHVAAVATLRRGVCIVIAVIQFPVTVVGIVALIFVRIADIAVRMILCPNLMITVMMTTALAAVEKAAGMR